MAVQHIQRGGCRVVASDRLLGVGNVGGHVAVESQPTAGKQVPARPPIWTPPCLTSHTSLSIAEVKAHLSELASRVNGQHERITVTVHGKPSAVLLAPEDLDSLEETIAILSDPEAMRRLIASDQQLVAGEGESESDLADAIHHQTSGAARGR